MSELTNRSDELVRDYLAALDRALAGLSQREEILDDLRSHIESERAARPEPSEIEVRRLLDRLGPPETVAAAARAEEPSATVQPVPRSGWSARRIVLTVLAVVGGLVTLMFVLLIVGAVFFVGSDVSGGGTDVSTEVSTAGP